MVLVNGEPGDAVSVKDRGLAYGDGVFRTLRCEGGKVWFWRRHMAKLHHDCHRLGLDCPPESVWRHDLEQLAPIDGAIKLMVTRGVSGRGYACDPGASVTRITQVTPLPEYARHRLGANTVICNWRLGTQVQLAGVKHLNRLDQVMARREWDDAGIFDGLMLNARDEVVEGVVSNLFVLVDDQLYTHPLNDCGVAGVSRDALIDLVEDQAVLPGRHVSLTRQPFNLAFLCHAHSVILCNSLAGIVEVRNCKGHQFAPSPWVNTLAAAFDQTGMRESYQCGTGN